MAKISNQKGDKVKYILLTFVLIFCTCGSVRKNRTVLNDCENERDMYKRGYSQALIREQMYKQRADSMQVQIWFLESDIDSLRRELRDLKYIRRDKSW